MMSTDDRAHQPSTIWSYKSRFGRQEYRVRLPRVAGRRTSPRPGTLGGHHKYPTTYITVPVTVRNRVVCRAYARLIIVVRIVCERAPGRRRRPAADINNIMRLN